MASKQRNYSNEFKAKVVLEVVSGQRSISEASRAHKVHSSVINRWRNEFLKQAHLAFGGKGMGEDSEEKIGELERMIGRLTMELAIAKKGFSAVEPERKRMIIEQMKGEYPIQAICDVIGYSRSRYYYQPQIEKETEEEALKQAINNVAGRYPTYGYRRLTKQLQREGWNVNHKRITRLMRELGLLAKRKIRKRAHNQQRSWLQAISQLSQRACRRTARAGVGRRHHVHPTKGGVCVFSGANGRVYSQHTRLALR